MSERELIDRLAVLVEDYNEAECSCASNEERHLHGLKTAYDLYQRMLESGLTLIETAFYDELNSVAFETEIAKHAR